MDKPYLIWITGLAGSGKTTLAKEIYKILIKKYPNTIHLDGDNLEKLKIIALMVELGRLIFMPD